MNINMKKLLLALFLIINPLKSMNIDMEFDVDSNEFSTSDSDQSKSEQSEQDDESSIDDLDDFLKITLELNEALKQVTPENLNNFIKTSYQKIERVVNKRSDRLDLDYREAGSCAAQLREMVKFYQETLPLLEKNQQVFSVYDELQQQYSNQLLPGFKRLWITHVFYMMLHNAVTTGKKDDVEELLEIYQNQMRSNKKLELILLHAIRLYYEQKKKKMRYLSIIKKLLNKGANITIQYPDPNPTKIQYLDEKSGKYLVRSTHGTVIENLMFLWKESKESKLKPILEKYKDYFKAKYSSLVTKSR